MRTPILTRTSALTVALLCSWLRGGSTQAQVLFSADFDDMPDGQPPAAPFVGGGDLTAVRGGRLFLGSERSNPVLTLDRAFSGDVALAVDVRDAAECHWSGVAFKGVYQFTVNRQFGTLSCVKRAPGVDPLTMATCKGYGQHVHNVNAFRLSITQLGHDFACTIDGRKLLSFTDPEAPESGKMQFLGGWGTRVYFDNLVISRATSLPRSSALRKRSVAPEGFRARGKLNRADGVYFDGETVAVEVRVENASQRDFDLPVEYRVIDYWEETVTTQSRQLEVGAGGTASHRLDLSPGRRGIFKLALWMPAADGELAWATDTISFGVVPRSVGETPPNVDSYFGGHAEQMNADFHLAFLRKLGVKWVRCHDVTQMTWWNIVEPEDDQWTWRDEHLATIRRHGMQILGEFCKTPAWAARMPDGMAPTPENRPETYPPADWDEYAEYVRETVNHYKSGIKHWEVWNEPNHGGFWRGTPEEYVKLLEVTYRTAKEADPDCTIVGIGGVALSQMDWLRRAFAAGPVEWMDDLSTHGYVDAVRPMDLLETESRLPEFRALLKEHGFTGGLWDSEHSIRSTSFIDDFRLDYLDEDAPYHFRTAAENMMKTYVFEVAQGYKRVFPYLTKWLDWVDNEKAVRDRPIHQNLFDVYGTPKPMAIAHAITAYMMEGAKYRRTLNPHRCVQLFVYERDGDTLVCYWGRFGRHRLETKLRLGLPTGIDIGEVERIDLMGNHHRLEFGHGSMLLPLSPEPVWLWIRGRTGEVVDAWLEGAAPAEPIEIDFSDLTTGEAK